MQLKRDTEYALRILLAAAEKAAPRGEPPQGVTLNEISALSGVPRVGIDRICAQLESAGLLQSRRAKNGERLYAAASALYQKSLLDLLLAMEQGVPLFAVFDKGSGFFSKNEKRMLHLQEKADRLLDGEKLEDYFS